MSRSSGGSQDRPLSRRNSLTHIHSSTVYGLQEHGTAATSSLRKQVRFDDTSNNSNSKSRSHWLDELQERKGDVLKWLEDVGTKRKDAIAQTAQASKVCIPYFVHWFDIRSHNEENTQLTQIQSYTNKNWFKNFAKRKDDVLSPKSPFIMSSKSKLFDCLICQQPIQNIEDLVQTAGCTYHAACVVCVDCQVPVHPNQFVEGPDGEPILLCETDYQRRLKAITTTPSSHQQEGKSTSKSSKKNHRHDQVALDPLVFCEGCRRPIVGEVVEAEEDDGHTHSNVTSFWHPICVKFANAWEFRAITFVPIPRGIPNWRSKAGQEIATQWEDRIFSVFTGVDSFEAGVFKTCTRLSRFLDRNIPEQAERYGTRLVRRLDRLFRLLDEMRIQTDLTGLFAGTSTGFA